MYNRECLHKELFSMQDMKYRDFSANLIPTVDKEKIIGIRTPVLRSFAKKFAKTSDVSGFLTDLPHKYLEENHLHAFIIESFSDFDNAVEALNDFLPYIDNWATCDSMSPKILAKNTDKLIPVIQEWIKSKHVYQVRFALLCLMRYFLDDNFNTKYIDLVLMVNTDDYYIHMMVAWFFATALAKQYSSVLPYIKNKSLDISTHNKAIQKAIESRRISEEQKAYLRSLRQK